MAKDKRTEYDAELPKNTGSTILSGAGNGLMLGSIPLAGSELYIRMTHGKPLSLNVERAYIFTAVAGCVLGAVYGLKEAREINNYRASLRAELNDLRARTEINSQKIDSWTDKEKSRSEARDAAPERS